MSTSSGLVMAKKEALEEGPFWHDELPSPDYAWSPFVVYGTELAFLAFLKYSLTQPF